MANAVTRERNSNHELMRILSMFFIVLGHVFLFGRLLDTPNKSMSIIYYFFEFILIVHVNSYVLYLDIISLNLNLSKNSC